MKCVILFCLVIFFFTTIVSSQELVLYTTLNDASSITSPSTGPAGTQNNGSFAAAQYGNGFLSDAAEEYVSFDIGSTSTSNEAGKLNLDKGTIAFWYKAESSAGERTFLSIGSGDGELILEQVNNRGQKLQLTIGDKVLSGVFNTTSGTLYHIAVVWDINGHTDIGDNNFGVYVNVSFLFTSPLTWPTNAFSSSTFYIGSKLGGSDSSLGEIDDLYIYNDVLTSTQINNIKDSQVLPVELVSFSANLLNNSVVLNWETATEINNYGFEVERITPPNPLSRVDGNVEWEKIGFVNGHGNSNSLKYYSYIDENLINGNYEYRLKQIDFDGTYEYSDVISINVDNPIANKLFQNNPNPFNPSTAIKFFLTENSNVDIKIYDVLGKEITTIVRQDLQAGSHITYWNGKDNNGMDVASGVYIYTLTAGNFTESKKMNLLK